MRLASQLTGWDIDIVSESEDSERRSREFTRVTELFVGTLNCDEMIAQLLATEGFGSREEAPDWLQRPALALDGRRPIDLLRTPTGAEAVGDHLTRLEYGVYT